MMIQNGIHFFSSSLATSLNASVLKQNIQPPRYNFIDTSLLLRSFYDFSLCTKAIHAHEYLSLLEKNKIY